MKKFYVVDQNFFRAPLLQELTQDPNNRFVIPDAAFFEMSKAPEWKSTYKSSLRILAESPKDVFLSKSVGQVWDEEIKLRRYSSNIISKQGTALLRDLLGEIKSGADGPVFSRFESGMLQSQVHDIGPRLDHEKIRAALVLCLKQSNL